MFPTSSFDPALSALLNTTTMRQKPVQETYTYRPAPFGAGEPSRNSSASASYLEAGVSSQGLMNIILNLVMQLLLENLFGNGGSPFGSGTAERLTPPIPGELPERLTPPIPSGTGIDLVYNDVVDPRVEWVRRNSNNVAPVSTDTPGDTGVNYSTNPKPSTRTTITNRDSIVWGDPHYETFQNQKFDFHGTVDELVRNINAPNFQYANVMKPWGSSAATVNGNGFMLVEDLAGEVHEVLIDVNAQSVLVDGEALKLNEPYEFVLADINAKDDSTVLGSLELKQEGANKFLEYQMGEIAGRAKFMSGGHGKYLNNDFFITDLDNTYNIDGIIGDQTDADYVDMRNHNGKNGYFFDTNGNKKVDEGEHKPLDSYVLARKEADKKDTSNDVYFELLEDAGGLDTPVEYGTLGVEADKKAEAKD